MLLGARAFYAHRIVRLGMIRERLQIHIMMMIMNGIAVMVMVMRGSDDGRNCAVMTRTAGRLHGRGQPLRGQRSDQ